MAKKEGAVATPAKATGGLLGKLAAKAPVKAASKDDTPIVEHDATPAQLQAMEKLIGAKKQMRQAESTIEQSEEILLPVCKDLRKKNCMDSQQFRSSIKIKMKGKRIKKDEGGKEITEEVELEPVTLSTAQRYSEIPLGDGEKLDEIFGEVKEKCFQQITQIALTEEGVKECVATQEDPNGLLARVVAAAGGLEKFEKLFGVKQFYKPTEYLHEEAVRDPKLAQKYEKAVAEQVIKPQKPSFRVS